MELNHFFFCRVLAATQGCVIAVAWQQQGRVGLLVHHVYQHLRCLTGTGMCCAACCIQYSYVLLRASKHVAASEDVRSLSYWRLLLYQLLLLGTAGARAGTGAGASCVEVCAGSKKGAICSRRLCCCGSCR